ncbi:MAG: hypothetical protein QUU85_11570, partial [Candidatus Eisenbacteria bacterium]|nr:hypothetical protein [Candidatus Eisenbacteria bacterium]
MVGRVKQIVVRRLGGVLREKPGASALLLGARMATARGQGPRGPETMALMARRCCRADKPGQLSCARHAHLPERLVLLFVHWLNAPDLDAEAKDDACPDLFGGERHLDRDLLLERRGVPPVRPGQGCLLYTSPSPRDSA